MLQLPTPLVFIGCLLSDAIPLSKRTIIRRPIFEQINTCYKVEYFTECILSETQKEKNEYITQQTEIIKQYSIYDK